MDLTSVVNQKRFTRIYSSEEFYHESQFSQIIDDMPNLDSFLEETDSIRIEQTSQCLMAPCYQRSVLTAEQEIHEFRKYNFYKFRAKHFYDAGEMELAEEQMKLADKIRDELTYSNTRLVPLVLRPFGSSPMYEDLVSEGYNAVFRAIDYFDWRRGYKFSTYASNTVLRTVKNYLRIHHRETRRQVEYEKSVLENFKFEDCERDEALKTLTLEELKTDVEQLIESCNCSEREKFILLERFYKERFLADIGTDLNISKERVRQIQNFALKKLRTQLETTVRNYESHISA